jgi:hypothetical protein
MNSVRRSALLGLLAAAVLSACGLPADVRAPGALPAPLPPFAGPVAPTGPAPTAPTRAPLPPIAAQPPATAPVGDAQTALAVLSTLPVRGRAPLTGYSRGRFGEAWTDVDGDGCDQRNQILSRDLTEKVFKRGTRDCVVLSGRLVDPYTGRVIAFKRGNKTSEAVQIDHVVALANAWRSGADRLDPATLLRLANDPLNLLAVDGPTNQAKKDSDAATWLPPAKGYRCAYVSRQVAVKRRYGLWVTPAEQAAMVKVLDGCVGQPLVTD